MNKKHNFFLLIGCLAICQFAGFIGSIFNVAALSEWYDSLEKSILNPPGWVFGPVWITLFLLMGISLYLIIKTGHGFFSGKGRYFSQAMIWFSVQWILNIGWSFFFFYLQEPIWAFYEIILLLIAIVGTIHTFCKINRKAAYLLLPYLAWVAFAAYLNISIWFLNY